MLKFIERMMGALPSDAELRAYERGFADGIRKADANYQPLIDQLTDSLNRLRELERRASTVDSLLQAFKGGKPT